MINTDPNFDSHWLVSTLRAFGNYLKATVLYLLREKWRDVEVWAAAPAAATQYYVYIYLHWACINDHLPLIQISLTSSSFCGWSDLFIIVNLMFELNVWNYPQVWIFPFFKFCAFLFVTQGCSRVHSPKCYIHILPLYKWKKKSNCILWSNKTTKP